MDQVQQEGQLSGQPHGGDGGLAFLADEHDAEHVQPGKGELLDDDGDGDLADIGEVVGVGVVIAHTLDESHAAIIRAVAGCGSKWGR
jgi:hypothetical protein